MFLSLFYLLRANRLKVSLDEWLMLLEGMRKGLHGSTLDGFYTLCRAVVVTSEVDFDRFDQVFLEFFRGVEPQEQLPEELRKWLEHPELTREDIQRLQKFTGLSEEEIETLFARRLQDQKEEHNGGRKWIGTDGYTAFGNQGERMGGIRVGGESRYRSAYRLAGERRYRDWRTDCTLDSRQFQQAFRGLRQLSRLTDTPKTELDVDATIQKTCQNGGMLRMEYTFPRKNTLKLLLLIDSGGSMEPYQRLCSMLFQAVSKAGHFKDLKIFYFHNRPGNLVYKDPALTLSSAVETEWILKNLFRDYRVIFIGDAEMSVNDLLGRRGAGGDLKSGIDWLLEFKNHYSHIIWLHPQMRPNGHSYWTQSFDLIAQQFPMYQITLEELTLGIKRLLVAK